MPKKQKRINDALRLLDNSYNVQLSVVKLNIHNTIKHELAKCIQAYKLVKRGKQIVTEAVFKNGTRADIFCLNDFAVYEVLHSETEKEALEKVKKYPKELDIFLLRTEEIFDEVFKDG